MWLSQNPIYHPYLVALILRIILFVFQTSVRFKACSSAQERKSGRQDSAHAARKPDRAVCERTQQASPRSRSKVIVL